MKESQQSINMYPGKWFVSVRRLIKTAARKKLSENIISAGHNFESLRESFGSEKHVSEKLFSAKTKNERSAKMLKSIIKKNVYIKHYPCQAEIWTREGKAISWRNVYMRSWSLAERWMKKVIKPSISKACIWKNIREWSKFEIVMEIQQTANHVSRNW